MCPPLFEPVYGRAGDPLQLRLLFELHTVLGHCL